ncbi:putative ADP-ribosylation factor GTPase-activating protein AGD14 [Bienertia sinuspersici]
MANRLKEDEKNEKIIRGLLKQPGNRRCINCNTLGPQYVCITFSTFICTTCGGIHREFTHRVKSVSMAKFTPQEITSLQAGGNERAKEIYFKDWDSQRPVPDSSNVDRLRDFIKHVYVDKRYSGERGSDRPPRGKLGDKEEPTEHRRSDSYQSGSRSPPYDDKFERRYSGRSSPGYDARSPGYDGRSPGYDARRSPGYDARRSPGYDQDNHRHSDYGRSPVRSGNTGIVSNWRREDRFTNGRKSDDRRSSDGESRPEIRSPDSQKDSSVSSLPTVRPVGEILGENVVPLRISEPPKANSVRVADGSKLPQRTASSSSLASSNGNPVELKKETSLIDFGFESEPPVTAVATQTQQPSGADNWAAATQAQQSSAGQSVVQETSAQSDDNWACFDNVQDVKVSQVPQSTNPLDVLTELSVPVPGHASGSTSSNAAPVPSSDMFPSSSGDLLFDSVGAEATAAFSGAAPASSTLTSLSSFPSGGAEVASGPPPTLAGNGGTYQQYGMQQQQQAITHSAASQPAAPQWASAFASGSGNQASIINQNSFLSPLCKEAEVMLLTHALIGQGVTGNSAAQVSQAFTKPQSQTVEVKSNDRKELPANLFTGTYAYAPYQAPGWQAGVRGMFPGTGFPMQYNPAMSMQAFPQPTFPQQAFPQQAFPQPTKSANPFDAEGSSVQPAAMQFPSMSSLHAALPNAAAPRGTATQYGSAIPGGNSVPPQLSTMPPVASAYGSAMPGGNSMPPQLSTMPPGGPSFGSAMPSGAYMGQQIPPNMMASRPQGFGTSGSEGPGMVGSMNPAAAMPNPSLGGNPFG